MGIDFDLRKVSWGKTLLHFSFRSQSDNPYDICEDIFPQNRTPNDTCPCNKKKKNLAILCFCMFFFLVEPGTKSSPFKDKGSETEFKDVITMVKNITQDINPCTLHEYISESAKNHIQTEY